ncbi:MAG: hypothetical protein CL579_13100 [Alteromonadaceae bacterium]|jgi:hypothetical protein|nr:hypothetical protein [Alteromonadaceae bacterium]MBB19457.1 hypothetical protein [Rickettsiales bacterium]
MYKQETLRIEGFPLYLAAYTNTDHAVKPVQLKLAAFTIPQSLKYSHQRLFGKHFYYGAMSFFSL